VELVSPETAVHAADLDLWEQAWRLVHLPAEAADVARAYWRGDDVSGRFEYLTESDLRIIGVIERSTPR
jgi:hypothetical protein